MNDASARAVIEGRIIGHVLAINFRELGQVFVVTPVAVHPPSARMVGLSEPPVGEGSRLATADECCRLAFMAADQMTVRDPGMLHRADPNVRDLLSLLWPAMQRVIFDLMQDREPNALTRMIAREADYRVEERLIGVREAARQRGLGEAANLVRALVAIAAEGDVTARAAALAAIAPELRRVLPDD